MTYRVGQKVVCIYDCPQHLRPAWASYPEINRIYTVRGHVKGTRGKELLLLEEVLNPIRDSVVGPCEYGFQAAGFRPAVVQDRHFYLHENAHSERIGAHMTDQQKSPHEE